MHNLQPCSRAGLPARGAGSVGSRAPCCDAAISAEKRHRVRTDASPPRPSAYDAVDLRVGDEPREIAPGVFGRSLRAALRARPCQRLAARRCSRLDGDRRRARRPAEPRALAGAAAAARSPASRSRRLVATHFHPDHLGLAGWLCELTGAELWTSHSEWLTGRWLAQDTSEGFVAAGRAFDRRAGLAEDAGRGAGRARQPLSPPRVRLPPSRLPPPARRRPAARSAGPSGG